MGGALTQNSSQYRLAAGVVTVLGIVAALGACMERGSVPPPSPREQTTGSGGPSGQGLAELRAMSQRLRPLQLPLGEPQPGEWLAEHPEDGQTFEEWLASSPTTARGSRRVIYVLPLGDMSPAQRKLVDDSADYLRRFFQLRVETLEPISEDEIPADHKRDWTLGLQLHSVYILDEVLYPRVPKDAAALIALTAIDLYPQESWNFVFGQASLNRRVGVWSMARNGDPERNYRQVLERTLNTATHETGHMFSIEHCTAYLCNLCGSNSMAESDRHPLQLCAECLPKLLHATGAEPQRRFEALIEFCEERGLEEAAKRWRALKKAAAGD
jgi:archaemetzincin